MILNPVHWLKVVQQRASDIFSKCSRKRIKWVVFPFLRFLRKLREPRHAAEAAGSEMMIGTGGQYEVPSARVQPEPMQKLASRRERQTDAEAEWGRAGHRLLVSGAAGPGRCEGPGLSAKWGNSFVLDCPWLCTSVVALCTLASGAGAIWGALWETRLKVSLSKLASSERTASQSLASERIPNLYMVATESSCPCPTTRKWKMGNSFQKLTYNHVSEKPCKKFKQTETKQALCVHKHSVSFITHL